MLSKEIFKDGMQILVDSYPNWKFKYDDPKAMKTWYGFFKHMDDERFMYMINAYVGYSDRFPTVAGLKECDTIPRKSRDQHKHEKMLRELEEEKRRERAMQ